MFTGRVFDRDVMVRNDVVGGGAFEEESLGLEKSGVQVLVKIMLLLFVSTPEVLVVFR